MYLPRAFLAAAIWKRDFTEASHNTFLHTFSTAAAAMLRDVYDTY